MVRAVILAAGQGTRLRPHTDDRPKCLVELAGMTLLERQLAVLRAVGVAEVSIVTGFRADAVRAIGLPTYHNSDFATTNMVASLFCADAVLRGIDDVIVAYGDIVYEPRVLQGLLAADAPIAVTVDLAWRRYWERRFDDPLSDAETLRMDAAGRILEIGKKPDSYEDIQGQYVGLIKVRAEYLEAFRTAHERLDRGRILDGKHFRSMYMTTFLQHLIDSGWDVRAAPTESGWLEVDTTRDLALYEDLARQAQIARFYDPDCVNAAAHNAALPFQSTR